jgi:hypothetical protein
MVRVNDFLSDIVAISFLLAAPAARAEVTGDRSSLRRQAQ